MPKLTLPVRIAASSIFVLSFLHTVFWLALSLFLAPDVAIQLPYSFLRFLFGMFSLAGVAGVLIAIGLFRARNWARIAALVLGALVAFFCAFSLLVLLVLIFGVLPAAGPEIELHSVDFLRLFIVYLLVFSLAIWWIVLFARKRVAAQFSSPFADAAIGTKPACPKPIALLAWLMILSSTLSAISWPLILGRIPAMLFTHVFSPGASKWIWAANIFLFLVCAIGLLKLQRWSYTGVIALHVFWLVSLFVSQLSPHYESYTRLCLDTLELADTYPILNRLHFPQWVSATMTAIPTALLIAGLFYYRRSFFEAVDDSHHPSS
jgi:hypothetical protein